MFGEYKTPGGKLVRVNFDVTDGRLENVQITGDFFLYPEEALESITNAVEGQAASVNHDALVSAIESAVAPDVKLVGFSPEAIAIAMERGLKDDG